MAGSMSTRRIGRTEPGWSLHARIVGIRRRLGAVSAMRQLLGRTKPALWTSPFQTPSRRTSDAHPDHPTDADARGRPDGRGSGLGPGPSLVLTPRSVQPVRDLNRPTGADVAATQRRPATIRWPSRQLRWRTRSPPPMGGLRSGGRTRDLGGPTSGLRHGGIRRAPAPPHELRVCPHARCRRGRRPGPGGVSPLDQTTRRGTPPGQRARLVLSRLRKPGHEPRPPRRGGAPIHPARTTAGRRGRRRGGGVAARYGRGAGRCPRHPPADARTALVMAANSYSVARSPMPWGARRPRRGH